MLTNTSFYPSLPFGGRNKSIFLVSFIAKSILSFLTAISELFEDTKLNTTFSPNGLV
jgi:hypothetical protein